MSDAVVTAPAAAPVNADAKQGGGIGGKTGEQKPVSNPINPNSEERFKIKVNNQEREYSLAELKTLAAKAEGADERFRSASEIEKKAKAILEAPKSKALVKTLMEQGYSKLEIRNILEQELTPFVEDDMMSPEERRLKEERARLKEYEEREKADKDRTERERKEREDGEKMSRELKQLNDEFLDAIEKENLPRDPFLAKMIAQHMIAAEKKGYSISAAEAAQLVSQQFTQNTQHLLNSLSVDKLKQILGKDTLSKLREADVKAVRDAESPFTKQAKNPAVKQGNKPTSQVPVKKEASSFFNKLRGVNYNKE